MTTDATAPTEPARITGPHAPVPGMRPVPEGHPARTLGTCEETHEDLFLNMDVHGGWNDPEAPALTHWQADFVAIRRDENATPVPVASMLLTVVNPLHGDPVEELDMLDQDSGELGAALFSGHDRTEAFGQVAEDDGGPVLLVDAFEVEPAWRGTDLTPIMALRVLKVFTNLGIDSAALCAAPISEDMSTQERTRIGTKIAQMWQRAGFTPIPTEDVDGYDNIVMAASFDRDSLDAALRRLSEADLFLAAATDLW